MHEVCSVLLMTLACGAIALKNQEPSGEDEARVRISLCDHHVGSWGCAADGKKPMKHMPARAELATRIELSRRGRLHCANRPPEKKSEREMAAPNKQGWIDIFRETAERLKWQMPPPDSAPSMHLSTHIKPL